MFLSLLPNFCRRSPREPYILFTVYFFEGGEEGRTKSIISLSFMFYLFHGSIKGVEYVLETYKIVSNE